MALFWIIGFSVLASLGAVGGAGLLLIFPDATRKLLVPHILAYAVGTLLAAALLGMIPTAAESLPLATVTGGVLFGIVVFFGLEAVVKLRHCHDADCPAHGTAAPLVLIGDALHNFVDGVVIAAAFLTSVPLGIAAAVAAVAHEVPQEVGDVGILLDAGYSPRSALIWNALSSAMTLVGAVAGYAWLVEAQRILPYALIVAAASFIYIAIADLVPILHRHGAGAAALAQLVMVIAGIATIAAVHAG
jgi:zinc and cadmium transporter